MDHEQRPRIPVRRLLHTIHAVRDLKAARERYYDVLAAIAFGERVHEGEDRDMTLMYVADQMIELMAPCRPDDKTKTFARYIQRYGESHHSLELQVHDVAAARAACEAAGIELTSAYSDFFFIHPKSAGGIIIEVLGRGMRNDPAELDGWNRDWMKGHRSTLRRLDNITFVVRNLPAALDLLTRIFDGTVMEDDKVDFPQEVRRVEVRLGGSSIVLLSPDESTTGPLSDYLSGIASGLYALVWQVDDLERAKEVFASLGTPIVASTIRKDGFALDVDFMFGARHEFVPVPS